MNKIDVTDSSVPSELPVRRRNTQGVHTVNISVSVPQELNQKINGIVVRDSKSRSLVIAELLAKGLEASGITVGEQGNG